MISVIIPAYNDERFIGRCLDSIVSQSFKDYEVVLVLDGSTDKTKEIATSYIGKVNRLFVIEQKNAGAGKARNNGIDHSCGEFVVFVDADDWLDPDALNILHQIEVDTNADYIVANAITVEKYSNDKLNYRKIGHAQDVFVDERSAVSKLYFDLNHDSSSHSPWGKMFKSAIIKENNIRFPDLRRSQDIVFNNLYARYISSIFVSSKYIYYFWNTIYTSSIYKDKTNRRNTPHFIEAEKNHLQTMEVVVSTFYDTMDYRNYTLSDDEQQLMNDGFLVGIYNNIAANVLRSFKNAKYALDNYRGNTHFQMAIKSPKQVILPYKLLAFLLRNGLYIMSIIYVRVVEFLNLSLKNIKSICK